VANFALNADKTMSLPIENSVVAKVAHRRIGKLNLLPAILCSKEYQKNILVTIENDGLKLSIRNTTGDPQKCRRMSNT
jgi:hypothetical protein